MLKIILSVSNDNINASGAYIDHKDKRQWFPVRRFNDEQTAMQYLHDMRDNGAEFSIVINRSM